MPITTAQKATIRSTSQLVSPGARTVPSAARLSGLAPAYGLPRVLELPLRLEPVAPDTFGGLVNRASSTCRVVSQTNHPTGVLS